MNKKRDKGAAGKSEQIDPTLPIDSQSARWGQLNRYLHPWLSYRPDNKWELGVSPLAWYQLYRIISKEDDKYKAPLREWRSTLSVTHKQRVANNGRWINRLAGEYRMFSDGMNVLRTRIRTGYQIDITRRLQLLSYDELLLNLSGVSSRHLFDHNRIAFGTGYVFNARFSGEAGYLYVCRKPLMTTNTIRENNVYLQLSILL